MKICPDCKTQHEDTRKTNYCRVCMNKRSRASKKKYNARCVESKALRKSGKLFRCQRCSILIETKNALCDDCRTPRFITYADAAGNDRFHLRRTIEPTRLFE